MLLLLRDDASVAADDDEDNNNPRGGGRRCRHQPLLSLSLPTIILGRLPRLLAVLACVRVICQKIPPSSDTMLLTRRI